MALTENVELMRTFNLDFQIFKIVFLVQNLLFPFFCQNVFSPNQPLILKILKLGPLPNLDRTNLATARLSLLLLCHLVIFVETYLGLA